MKLQRRRSAAREETAAGMRGHFDRVPLSTKLVVIIFALLFVGCGTITFAIRQMVSGYLIDRLDNQLTSQAQLAFSSADKLAQQAPTSSLGVSNFFVQVRDSNNEILTSLSSDGKRVRVETIPRLKYDIVSTPMLPSSGSMGGVAMNTPFSTPAYVEIPDELKATSTDKLTNEQREVIASAQSPWRVVAIRWVNSSENTHGILYIGLSMGDQISTVETITEYCLIMSAAIIVLGVSIGSLVVQHTFKPLKHIEKTAAKIAAGDLSQRVPKLPENTEVGSLSASLNAMLSRIESSFHEQEATTAKMKRFVSDASHELRTPLAAIHGYAELYKMQRDYPGALERADEAIEHIEKSSTRMTVLVEDLLSLARLDEGRGIDLTQPVNITLLMSDAIEDLHALDPQRGIQVGQVQLGSAPVQGSAPAGTRAAGLCFKEGPMPQIKLTGDSSRIRQVITNIVGNLHRYTPNDSPVQVSLGKLTAAISPDILGKLPSTDQSLARFIEAVQVAQGTQSGTDYAVIQVVDHGPGVPADKRSQVFERFYTADPSRARQKGGTGLGLAIAQSVVKAHRGLICASETPGGGLTFTIILPTGTVSEPPADQTQPMQKKSGWSRAAKQSTAKTGGKQAGNSSDVVQPNEAPDAGSQAASNAPRA